MEREREINKEGSEVVFSFHPCFRTINPRSPGGEGFFKELVGIEDSTNCRPAHLGDADFRFHFRKHPEWLYGISIKL